MTILQWLTNTFKKIFGMKQLSGDPNNGRLTYISDDEALYKQNIRGYKAWYTGDATEILNHYSYEETIGFNSNPITNRNNRNFFWGLSATECNIKRIHSGFPRALVDSVSSIVGDWKAVTSDEALKSRIDNLIKKLDLKEKTIEYGRKMTLVTGEVAYKPIINKKISDLPMLEVLDAEDIETFYIVDKLVGIVYKSYYKDAKGKDYILLETHKIIDEGSAITFELFKLTKNNELEKVELDVLNETKLLPKEPLVLTGYKEVLGVVNKYYRNPIKRNKGWSLIAGCEDKFDELDEVWSQCSQTNRVSTPVEYYSADVLKRSKNGTPLLPSRYDRQYVALEGSVDGDGISKTQGITTTQPDLNFDKYMALQGHIENSILIGKLSPASLGIDVSRKDNADAQREKEKISLLTRNRIIDRESESLKKLITLLLMLEEYMLTGKVTFTEYDFTIQYDEFANPSIESKLPVLGGAWSQGQISTKQYVNLLWKDKLSNEELLEEIAYLEEQKSKESLDLGGLLNEGPTRENLPTEEIEQEESAEVEK